MRNITINKLVDIAKNDKDIVLMTGDLGFSVLESFAENYPDRFINAGVAEQNMVGMAAGLALSGKTVFTYSITNFATLRCLEQIRVDVCYHNANVKIISVGAGYAYGSHGYTHFGIEDISVLRALPNMQVYSPSCSSEAQMLIQHIAKIDGPCYLRLGRGGESIAPNKSLNEYIGAQQIPMLPILEKNSDYTILATADICQYVRKLLVENNLSYNLWSVPSIKPMDLVNLSMIINNSKKIFTVEEHQLDGGFGSAILEAAQTLIEKKQIQSFPKIQRCGINNFISEKIGSQDYMRKTTINLEEYFQ